MKLVLTDCQTITNGDLNLGIFDRFGEVARYPFTTPAETAARIADADIVLCNKTVLDESTLRDAARLRYIGLLATGCDNVDLAFSAAHGITVTNAGTYSTAAVAQHVFALLLAHTNRIADYHRFVEGGGWQRSETFSPFVFPIQELAGRTFGILGYGAIGKATADIARSFGMRVLVHTRTRCPENRLVLVDWETLLRESDVLSVHCPLTEKTRHLLDAAAFSLCKPGLYLINTARGGIVDNEALRNALIGGRLSGTAIDVLDQEPMAPDCPLLHTPNLLITPHVAWAPLETRRRLLAVVVENLSAYLAGTPQNTVCIPQ